MNRTSIVLAALLAGLSGTVSAQDLAARVDSQITDIHDRILVWRSDIRQHPELSNRETRTSALVAEDFAYFQQRVSGLFYFVGITPPDQDPATAAPNHSPHFYIDESGAILGARSLAALAVDLMQANR